jgi:hypothetical protein
MKSYPTFAEVEEMRSLGYDVSVLAEQLELAKRGAILEALVVETEKAFAGVALGAGIGLLEANGLDDEADEKSLAALRAKDERLDWHSIPVSSLDRYSCSLSYFDAEGMRFHLPAFLLTDMREDHTIDLVNTLTTGSPERFALLTAPQRAVVRKYLQFLAEEEWYESDRAKIHAALAGYWST